MCPKSIDQLQEIREQRKEQILSAALELFAQQGYHATSMQQISKNAGISKGLSYNYFESKDEILSTLFLRFSKEIMEMLDTNQDREITNTEVRQFIDNYFKYLEEKKEYCKFFMQITVQPGVLEMIMTGSLGQIIMKNNEYFIKFFQKLSKDSAEMEMLVFTSLLKGYSLQYVFAPGMITDVQKEGMKNMLMAILNRNN
ncbi:MAG: hypothetical protein CVU05_04660 [Bacteroidetes bacterium HGW-Bacteroidetes-21]|jgi:AcrR family transcriptional regulator|nr:MAG: hypothetical protein CVU05_04660 [Bacteroidetes bacterium HGW-Bacteroidetes-21]